MQRIFVIDKNKKPLMPCLPARARKLLSRGKAAVFRRYPFTIILLDRTEGEKQPLEGKFDPGSRTTGMALVGNFRKCQRVLWAANINHRGLAIKKSLDTKRAIRRGRRTRTTRYRKPRFNNRTRREGWLPPSLCSRVENVYNWAKKLLKIAPMTSIAVETVRFDTQKLQNPEITGVEYQQGTLTGYEIREYLLEKWGRECAYCGDKDTRLEIDHITPRSRGGVDRVSNLVICCRDCNEKKKNLSVQEFLKNQPLVLSKILTYKNVSLKDTVAVNATRYAIGSKLKSFGRHVSFWSGGRTKHNRCSQGYPKDHWIDAVCVGDSGLDVHIPKGLIPLEIVAMGRGSRQYCRMDRYGFPRTRAKSKKRMRGFQTGDLVKAFVPKGKKQGLYAGYVAIRSTGNFNIKTMSQTVQGINVKYCQLIQNSDGYRYNNKKEQRFLPTPKDGVFALSTR